MICKELCPSLLRCASVQNTVFTHVGLPKTLPISCHTLIVNTVISFVTFMTKHDFISHLFKAFHVPEFRNQNFFFFWSDAML